MEMEEAIPALCKARKSGDPEVRRRAVECLRALARKAAPRGLARAKLLGKAGRIVEAADRVAYWGILDSGGEGWEILTQFAEKVNVSTARHFPSGGLWRSSNCPKGDFHRYAANAHPREIAAPMIDLDAGGGEPILKDRTRDARNIITYSNGMLLLRGRNICLTKKDNMGIGLIHDGIVAASGDVQVEVRRNRSLIIAGGNVKVTGLRESIIICDGDVELTGPGNNDIIIARGKVTCIQEKNRRNSIRSGSCKCLIRSGSCLELPGGKTIDLKDGTPDPLAFVKFFELADVGLAAEDLPRARNPIPRVSGSRRCARNLRSPPDCASAT